MSSLLTVGHGTLAAGDLAALLREAGVACLVDVRSYPGSRRNPHFGRDAMERWVPEAGIGYRWERDLGGRRRPVPGSRHVALRVEAFRAYADHMETGAFREGIERLLAQADEAPSAVMCSESLWWRCHRRLLADHLVLVRGVGVQHLMHDGRLAAHQVTDGARRAEGHVVYDAGQAPLGVGRVSNRYGRRLGLALGYALGTLGSITVVVTGVTGVTGLAYGRNDSDSRLARTSS